MERKEHDEHFARWWEEHRPVVYKVANAFATGADRDDLVQEMLIGLWKAIPSFRGDSKESTFVYRVVNNCALTWTRGEKRRRDREANAAAEQMSQPGDPRQVDTRLEQLFRCIRKLPALDRSVITMSLDGLGHAEIGEVIGAKENAISVRIHRVRKHLATAIKSEERQHEN